MRVDLLTRLTLFCFVLLSSPAAQAIDIADYPALKTFISEMRTRHNMPEADLIRWFEQATVRMSIIDVMNRPSEALPWHEYRKQFVTDDHAKRGVRFWQQHAAALSKASAEYGVPAEIILAILGIETQYGRNKGGFSVLDALATLTLEYPRRSGYFRGELEQFLLLARDMKTDPASLTGSYAGAMGYPQFMPSSYRNYAVDFDGDNNIDLLNSVTDAIGSVANYFKRHGWEPGQPIIDEVQLEGGNYIWFLNLGIKPHLRIKYLGNYGIFPVNQHDPERNAALIELQEQHGPAYLFGYNNFYVVTRYNRSTNYAMAVIELSRLIKAAYLSSHP